MVVGYGSRIGVASTYRDAVAFAILILVLLLRPSGILGTTVQEKV
jgi:branched-chain amino acid transport system permease protein